MHTNKEIQEALALARSMKKARSKGGRERWKRMTEEKKALWSKEMNEAIQRKKSNNIDTMLSKVVESDYQHVRELYETPNG